MNQLKKEEGIRVVAIGRWMPVHNGHKEFLLKLAEKGYVVVVIGSCYDNGTERNCIPAAEREKMIRAVFSHAGVSEDRYEIVNLPDRHNFQLWIQDMIRLCQSKKITHFCTGNQEDILNELQGENYGMEFIDPEINSTFPYHASDIRAALMEGDYELVKKALPPEVLPILFQYSLKEIIACCENKGISFSEGQQMANFLLLVKNKESGAMHVLLRNAKNEKGKPCLKIPGGPIAEFETPLAASVRILQEQTGLQVKVLDNSFEPAIAKIENFSEDLQQIRIGGIYENPHKKEVGSSQCFVMIVEDDVKKLSSTLKSLKKDKDKKNKAKFFSVSTDVKKKLLKAHKKMLKKAIEQERSYPDLTI